MKKSPSLALRTAVSQADTISRDVCRATCARSREEGKTASDFLKLNMYLVLARLWICFCLLVNFKWSFLYFYNVQWKLVPLRPEVWARGKTFEVCLLSSFVHQDKSKQNSNPFIIFDNHGRFLHCVSKISFSHLSGEFLKAAFTFSCLFSDAHTGQEQGLQQAW